MPRAVTGRSARVRLIAGALCVPALLAGCAVGPLRAPSPTSGSPAAPTSTTPAPPAQAPPPPSTAPATESPNSPAATSPSTAADPPTADASATGTSPNRSAPVIVIDPGHSGSVYATDPKTGLVVSDYENEPEMRDVFAVALIVRRRLRAAGYRVVLTKSRLDQRRDLARRAQIADAAHAALALSIHDQAGSNGGIGFDAGNNIVYYQRVGDYRQNPSGRKIVFTDRRVARLSRRYARIFAAQRHRVQGVPIRVQGDVGYNLGSRGLAPGNIWLVQLLSHVPWIYNEAGGNSPGRSGLDSTDRHRYAAGLVAAVEHCIPPPDKS